MITRQIQNPHDTPLRFQRTDDGFFNATELLSEYNSKAVGASEIKHMEKYKANKTTKEYSCFLAEKYQVKPMVTSKKGTWMHPHLFIDFAMWISLEFKDMAIKWILDGLIQERNDAGDYANQLRVAIVQRHYRYYGCKPAPMVYQNEFTMLKELAGIDDRNKATEKQLKVLNTLQQVDIKLISDKIGKESRRKHLTIVAEALK